MFLRRITGCRMGCHYLWGILEEDSRVWWCCAVSFRTLLTLRPWQTLAALIGGSPEGEVAGAQGAMTDARSSEHHRRITAWQGRKVFILVALRTELQDNLPSLRLCPLETSDIP